MIKNEVVGWYHQLEGYEFEQALGVGDGQGSLACCNPWDCKESDTTELNWTNIAGQAPLSSTLSQSLLKFMSIESVTPSNQLILCHPTSPALNPSQHQSLFQ